MNERSLYAVAVGDVGIVRLIPVRLQMRRPSLGPVEIVMTVVDDGINFSRQPSELAVSNGEDTLWIRSVL